MLRLIACVNEDGCIDGFTPPKADLQRFQALTMGCTVIMGRKTWETLPVKLKHRSVIVVSRNCKLMTQILDEGARGQKHGAIAAPSIRSAVHIATADDACGAWIAGGGEIYAQSINYCDMLFITHAKGRGGSVKFPDVSLAGFERIALQHHPDHDLCIYRRVGL